MREIVPGEGLLLEALFGRPRVACGGMSKAFSDAVNREREERERELRELSLPANEAKE